MKGAALTRVVSGGLRTPFCALDTVDSKIGSIQRIVRGTGNGHFFGAISPVLFVSRVRHFDGSRRSSLLGTMRANIMALVKTAARGPSFRIVHPLLSHYRMCILGSLRGTSLLALLGGTIARSVVLGSVGVILTRASTVLHCSNNSTQGLLGVLRLIITTRRKGRGVRVASRGIIRHLRRGPTTCSGKKRVRCSVVSTFVGSVHKDSPSTTIC